MSYIWTRIFLMWLPTSFPILLSLQLPMLACIAHPRPIPLAGAERPHPLWQQATKDRQPEQESNQKTCRWYPRCAASTPVRLPHKGRSAGAGWTAQTTRTGGKSGTVGGGPNWYNHSGLITGSKSYQKRRRMPSFEQSGRCRGTGCQRMACPDTGRYRCLHGTGVCTAQACAAQVSLCRTRILRSFHLGVYSFFGIFFQFLTATNFWVHVWYQWVLGHFFLTAKPNKNQKFWDRTTVQSQFFRKTTIRRRLISKLSKKTDPKPGMEIRRNCGPTPVARNCSGAKAPPLAARPLFLRSYQRYTTAQNHSTCQLRLTLYKLTGWLASLDLRKPCM